MPLTDVQIRKAKAGDKPLKLTDGGGLYLHVPPTGNKVWRLRYEIGGKEKLLTLAPYPDMSLSDAREARTAAKKLLREGKDPSAEKRRTKARPAPKDRPTFESVAREWHAIQLPQWTETHAYDVLHSLERDVFPTLGSRDVDDISAAEVLEVLREIEGRPAIETAKRVRQRMSAVFVYAIASGRAASDPAAIVQKALKPLKKGRQPAIVDPEGARKILRDVDTTPAHPLNKLAMRLLALTVLRPGTLLSTPWTELDRLDNARPLWAVPAARMKLRLMYKDDEQRDHLVPLPWQAVEIIKAAKRLSGRSPYVFPNARHAHRPASENMLGYLLNRAGYHHRHVPHGWRATFSTLMNERFREDRAVIDLMLAHVPKDRVEGAYNRAEHLERRREIAQEWADFITAGLMPIEDLMELPRRGSETPPEER